MRNTWITLIVALGLVGVGLLAAPALAKRGDADTDEGNDADARAARHAAREAYLDEKAQARERLHAALADVRAAHRACIENAQEADNRSAAMRACNEIVRGDGEGPKFDARLQHRLALERAKALFHERVRGADVDADDDGPRAQCQEDADCAARVVAVLQQRLERAEQHAANVALDLQTAQAHYENLSADPAATDDNATKAEDHVERLEAQLARAERHVARLQVLLEHWQSTQATDA